MSVDPMDRATPHAVAREIFVFFLIANSKLGFNETEVMIITTLGLNFEGLSSSAISDITGRNRQTISRRLSIMREKDMVERRGNVWRLTEQMLEDRVRRFGEVWAHIPKDIKDIVNREAARRRAAMQH